MVIRNLSKWIVRRKPWWRRTFYLMAFVGWLLSLVLLIVLDVSLTPDRLDVSIFVLHILNGLFYGHILSSLRRASQKYQIEQWMAAQDDQWVLLQQILQEHGIVTPNGNGGNGV